MGLLEEILADDPDAKPWKHHRQAADGSLERLIDPAVDMALLDEILDELEEPDPGPKPSKRATNGHWAHWRSPGDCPTMLLVIGVGVVGWTPEIERPPGRGESCEVCGSRRLWQRAACLSCLRSGIDHRFKGIRKLEPEPRRQYVPDPRGLKGGMGRAS